MRPGFLFVAVRGTERDGHDYLDAAAKAGATAAIVQDATRTTLPALVVNDGRRAAAVAAAAAYGFPARELQLVGVTGTNGKTTTVNLLRHLLGDDTRCGARRSARSAFSSEAKALRSTAAVDSRRRARSSCSGSSARCAIRACGAWRWKSRRTRCTSVASKACCSTSRVFTNLTRDHLDYHGTMEQYFAAKAMLIDHLIPHGTVVSNLDDPAWNQLRTDRRRVGFSERVPTAEVHAENRSLQSARQRVDDLPRAASGARSGFH